MTELLYHAPLVWPAGHAETSAKARSGNSAFSQELTIDAALELLREEIHALSPDRAVLHTDIEQISVERLRRKMSGGPGAFLEIKLSGKLYLFACDRWNRVEHNLYALHLILRNYRLMEKWGVAGLPRLMQGFQSNRSATAADLGLTQEEWMQALGLGPTATLEDAHATYRRRAKLVANDEDALMHLNNAMDQARKKLNP